MVRAALDGRLAGVATRRHADFGLMVPEACPEVPSEILDPRSTWRDDKAYDGTARSLVERFAKNFEQYTTYVQEPVRAAAIGAE